MSSQTLQNSHFDDTPYRYLSDNRKGYTCYRVPVTPETDLFTVLLRRQFILQAEELGYRGYDELYDERFHWRSSYFYVRNTTMANAPIFLCMRVTDADQELPFPFELGEYQSGQQYALADRTQMMDVNTFWGLGVKWLAGFQLLISAAGHYAYQRNCQHGFALVDVRNSKLEKIYCQYGGFRPSHQFHAPVSFPDYHYCESQAATSAPVAWKILEYDRRAIETCAMRAQQYQLAPHSTTAQQEHPAARLSL